MKSRWVWAMAGMAALMLPAAAVESASAAAVLKVGSQVADWQISHMEPFDYIPAGPHRLDTEGRRDWIQAAFYIGLTHFADVTGNPRYAAAVLAHGEAEGWGFDKRPRHADSDATAAVWIWAAQHTHDPAKLALTQARFDVVLTNPSTVSLAFGNHEPAPGGGEPCQARWCWCDALFMAPPAWLALTQATGDARYLAHADGEFWATTDYLYDPAEHLFYRDSRFFEQRDAAGHKIFWGRGNGWVFAGLARILTELPADYPTRPRYESLFKQMAARLAGLQGRNGYWPVSLLAAQASGAHAPPYWPMPETSGTGFFVYGLAWGVNHGLLPARAYRSSVQRGWRALVKAVQPEGKLGWVQRIGAAPDQVSADDTQLYGTGAFLLAASEVAGMP